MSIYLIGFGFGLGLWTIVTALWPAAPPLAAELARLHRSVDSQPVGTSSLLTRTFGASWTSSGLGRRLLHGRDADLRLADMTPAEYLAQRVLVAAIAALWAPATVLIMSAAGVELPIVVPIWASIALAPIGFAYPALALRTKVKERRRAFRHAFSTFLDIISVALASGKGVESALNDGANAGDGWVFDELRRALFEARLLGETPWAGLGRLGRSLEITELQELAASATLAGAQGARVRSSIVAKAEALRLHGLTDIESSAQAASERMSLPIVSLMMGFVVFLGYPAVMSVLRGL